LKHAAEDSSEDSDEEPVVRKKPARHHAAHAKQAAGGNKDSDEVSREEAAVRKRRADAKAHPGGMLSLITLLLLYASDMCIKHTAHFVNQETILQGTSRAWHPHLQRR
jgi:hypothetical protein